MKNLRCGTNTVIWSLAGAMALGTAVLGYSRLSGIQLTNQLYSPKDVSEGGRKKLDDEGWINADRSSKYDFSNISDAHKAFVEGLNNKDADLLLKASPYPFLSEGYLGLDKEHLVDNIHELAELVSVAERGGLNATPAYDQGLSLLELASMLPEGLPGYDEAAFYGFKSGYGWVIGVDTPTVAKNPDSWPESTRSLHFRYKRILESADYSDLEGEDKELCDKLNRLINYQTLFARHERDKIYMLPENEKSEIMSLIKVLGLENLRGRYEVYGGIKRFRVLKEVDSRSKAIMSISKTSDDMYKFLGVAGDAPVTEMKIATIETEFEETIDPKRGCAIIDSAGHPIIDLRTGRPFIDNGSAKRTVSRIEDNLYRRRRNKWELYMFGAPVDKPDEIWKKIADEQYKYYPLSSAGRFKESR